MPSSRESKKRKEKASFVVSFKSQPSEKISHEISILSRHQTLRLKKNDIIDRDFSEARTSPHISSCLIQVSFEAHSSHIRATFEPRSSLVWASFKPHLSLVWALFEPRMRFDGEGYNRNKPFCFRFFALLNLFWHSYVFAKKVERFEVSICPLFLLSLDNFFHFREVFLPHTFRSLSLAHTSPFAYQKRSEKLETKSNLSPFSRRRLWRHCCRQHCCPWCLLYELTSNLFLITAPKIPLIYTKPKSFRHHI